MDSCRKQLCFSQGSTEVAARQNNAKGLPLLPFLKQQGRLKSFFKMVCFINGNYKQSPRYPIPWMQKYCLANLGGIITEEVILPPLQLDGFKKTLLLKDWCLFAVDMLFSSQNHFTRGYYSSVFILAGHNTTWIIRSAVATSG